MSHDASSTPKALSENLAVQALGAELLVYDKARDVAHCLSAHAADVWSLCDGVHSVADLAVTCDLSDDKVEEILVELDAKGLLAGSRASSGISRRQLVERMAGTAAGAALVLSVAAPTASAQATGCALVGQPCSTKTDCCNPLANCTGSPKTCSA